MARKQRRLVSSAPARSRPRVSGMRPRATSYEVPDAPPSSVVAKGTRPSESRMLGPSTEHPTLIPPAKRTLRPGEEDSGPPSTPLDEILYRQMVGDFPGAAAVGSGLLVSDRIPVIVAPRLTRKQMIFQAAELAILSLIDDTRPVKEIINEGILPPAEAVLAICSLLDKGVIALR